MKRRILIFILTMAIILSGVENAELVVKAEGESEDISWTELMTENALIGYDTPILKGIYYSDGHSIINKISSTKVGAGGVTNAAVKCTVKITSILEKQTSSGWDYVTSWTQTNTNAFSAMISKSVIVGSGYYYRVRSYHYAGTDSSSSHTSALWIGN